MGLQPIVIPKGKAYSQEFDLTDPNTGDPLIVSGWTANGAIKEYYGSTETLYDWDSNNTELVDGKITITVGHEESKLWDWEVGYYEIEVIDSGGSPMEVSRGPVYARREITS